MAGIKFKMPVRFDNDVAAEGKWFEVYDEHDNHYGDFKLALADPESRGYKLAQERIRTKFAREIRSNKFDLDAFKKEMLLAVVLLDWRGLLGENDKPIPYSKDNARDYFDQPGVGFIIRYLMGEAEDVLNYQSSNKDEVSGN